jgi:hypothetical protein
MKTVKHVKAAVAKAGGALEEDTGFHDMRVLQAVAPDEKLWCANDCQCIVIHWAEGREPHALKHNEEALRSLAESLSHGLRDMTREEIESYY